MKGLAFLTILLAFAPLVAAQVPTVPPFCGPIDVSPVTPSGIAPGGSGTVTITIHNAGQNPQAANVSVAATTATPGWRVTDTDTKQVSLAAGATTTLSVNVVVAKDTKDSGIVNFALSGTCPPPGALPCPNAQCDFATRNVSATVPLVGGSALTIPGLEGVPIEYVAGGALLIVLGIVLVVAIPKRGRGFRADCPEPVKSLRAGRGASFPIEVRNETDQPLTARFDLSAVPEGWAAFLPLPEVQLAAKEARSLWLMVRAPPSAKSGERVDIEVTLTDAAHPRVTRTLKVRAEVNPDAPVT